MTHLPRHYLAAAALAAVGSLLGSPAAVAFDATTVTATIGGGCTVATNLSLSLQATRRNDNRCQASDLTDCDVGDLCQSVVCTISNANLLSCIVLGSNGADIGTFPVSPNGCFNMTSASMSLAIALNCRNTWPKP
jgi:hypothetical protein